MNHNLCQDGMRSTFELKRVSVQLGCNFIVSLLIPGYPRINQWQMSNIILNLSCHSCSSKNRTNSPAQALVGPRKQSVLFQRSFFVKLYVDVTKKKRISIRIKHYIFVVRPTLEHLSFILSSILSPLSRLHAMSRETEKGERYVFVVQPLLEHAHL